MDQHIKDALSAPRVGTYEAATTGVPALPAALALYAWNAQVSAAMLVPLHICEVVIRNAVSDALTAEHGPRWPWAQALERSLPDPPQGFNPKAELRRARNGTPARRHPTTGQVVADLKFVFWQKMFTGRFDGRIWNPHLFVVLPNLDTSKSVQSLRKTIHDDLELLRELRNRIAHHEPIFQRNLQQDLAKIEELIAFRCTDTAAWMLANQEVQTLIATKPP